MGAATIISGHQFSGKLRCVKANDLDEIISIDHDCFDPDIYWSGEDFTHYLTRPQSLSTIFRMAVLPATRSSPEIAAGYGLAAIEEKNCGSIVSMAVRKSFRGQGLGVLMLEQLCKNLQKKGATTIDLQVESTNKVAIKIYENFGFVETGPLPDYYAPGRHGLQMVLKP